MVFKQFVIPDDVWTSFGKRFKTDEQIREAMIDCIRVFGKYPANDKVIVVHGKDRNELQTLIGEKLDTVEDLLKEVRRAMEVKIEGVSLMMDPELLEQLKQQAEFYEKSASEYMAELIQERLALLIRGN